MTLLPWSPEHTLVLASASPQRRAILEQLAIPHVVRPTDVEEIDEGEPYAAAAANARAKARAALAALSDDAVLRADAELGGDAGHANPPGRVVIVACDTVVALDGRIYGKPADEAQAREHLAALAGRTHEVLGALAVTTPGGTIGERTDVTHVTFAPLTAAEIDRYLATGEWRGRAGGYAIQGRGAAIVEQIEGDYLNVVGLPVQALRALIPGLVPPFGGDLPSH
jgi:septum formation protein